MKIWNQKIVFFNAVYAILRALNRSAPPDCQSQENSVAIDPLKMESPPVLPVMAKYKANFESVRVMYERNQKLIK